MSQFMVSLVVTTTKANGEQDVVSTVRKYDFGDNPAFLGSGAAEALRQSTEELAADLEKDSQPLLGGKAGLPVRR